MSSPRRSSRRSSPRSRKATHSAPARGRGGATYGWAADAPKKGTVRHEMHRKCPECFLMPAEEKFPVCTSDCRYDCRGITAAKVRAGQYGYPKVAKKAAALEKKVGCAQRHSAPQKRKSSPRKRRSPRKGGIVRSKL